MDVGGDKLVVTSLFSPFESLDVVTSSNAIESCDITISRTWIASSPITVLVHDTGEMILLSCWSWPVSFLPLFDIAMHDGMLPFA